MESPDLNNNDVQVPASPNFGDFNLPSEEISNPLTPLRTQINSIPATPEGEYERVDPKTQNTPTPGQEIDSRVRVVCRARPFSESELERDESGVVELLDKRTICLRDKETPAVFTFDAVLGECSTQQEIYDCVGKRTLEDFCRGFNGTILAYGQTGSGKSYTMFGDINGTSTTKGLIPRIAENIFSYIASSSSTVEYMVGVSLMEVYKEHVYDLLDPESKGKEFPIHEDKVNGVYVKGLSQAFVSSPKEMSNVLKKGSRHRRTATTGMNKESSRSHAIFQVILTQKNIDSGEIRKSSLFLVDLAGSEKVDRSGASGSTLEEAKKINLSLSMLGLVINSLTDMHSTHIPYRDSKLTRILQESLGGNSRTTLIVNISPASSCLNETLSTLRFGSRAKRIKNTVHLNTELSVEQLKKRIAHLEKQNRALTYELRSVKDSIDGAADSMLLKSPIGDRDSSLGPPDSPSFSRRHPYLLSPLPHGKPIETSLIIQQDGLKSFSEELRRKDVKISQLEEELLSYKMASLTNQHTEDLKIYKLESALLILNEKLGDTELINTNLRKHLQISEKIIAAHGVKIEKLRTLVSEQQSQINKESSHFESKLRSLRSKLDAQKFREYSRHADQSYESDSSKTESFRPQEAGYTSPRNSSFKDDTVGSPLSPKIGLNLRIVKPVRGGFQESDIDESHGEDSEQSRIEEFFVMFTTSRIESFVCELKICLQMP